MIFMERGEDEYARIKFLTVLVQDCGFVNHTQLSLLVYLFWKYVGFAFFC
jgi:hypothetical protein